MKFALALMVGCALAAGACSKEDGNNLPTTPTTTAPSINVAYSATDLRAGSGGTATTGRLAAVRYTGWIYSTTAADNKGSQFDSGSFTFTVGSGVIQGFSMGVNGMQVGGIRRVVIPPSLGYANSPPANSGIRANETLLFEIELLAVQ